MWVCNATAALPPDCDLRQLARIEALVLLCSVVLALLVFLGSSRRYSGSAMVRFILRGVVPARRLHHRSHAVHPYAPRAVPGLVLLLPLRPRQLRHHHRLLPRRRQEPRDHPAQPRPPGHLRHRTAPVLLQRALREAQVVRLWSVVGQPGEDCVERTQLPAGPTIRRVAEGQPAHC